MPPTAPASSPKNVVTRALSTSGRGPPTCAGRRRDGMTGHIRTPGPLHRIRTPGRAGARAPSTAQTSIPRPRRERRGGSIGWKGLPLGSTPSRHRARGPRHGPRRRGTARGQVGGHRDPGALHRGDRFAAKLAGGHPSGRSRPERPRMPARRAPTPTAARLAFSAGTPPPRGGPASRGVRANSPPRERSSSPFQIVGNVVGARPPPPQRPASPRVRGPCGSKVLASFTISHEGRQAPRADVRRGVPAAARKEIPAPSPGGDARHNLSDAIGRSIARRRHDPRDGQPHESPAPAPSRRSLAIMGPSGRPDRRRPRPVLIPREVTHSRFPIFLKLAFAGLLGGLLLACNPSSGMFWQGLGLIAVGFLSLIFAVRGFGHRKPGSPQVCRGTDLQCRRSRGRGPADDHHRPSEGTGQPCPRAAAAGAGVRLPSGLARIPRDILNVVRCGPSLQRVP